MDSIDKEWARKYILDPLTAPEPSQETGPGSSHYNPRRASIDPQLWSRNYSKAQPQSQRQRSRETSRELSNHKTGDDKARDRPTPVHKSRSSRSGRSKSDSYSSTLITSSPTTTFHPSNPYASSVQSPSSGSDRKELPTPPNTPQTFPKKHNGPLNLNRSRSERSRADIRPLDVLEREKRVVDRGHRHRRRISDVDMIDSLDTTGDAYHHGGPYDATLISRNLHWKTSPLAAVHDSNMEAIRATPREFIIDSLDQHIPLQGTATIPAGDLDLGGNKMEYAEGTDMMRDANAPGGPYKRYADVKYHPDDLKGKGEPSYTFERDLKAKHRQAREGGSPDEIEMHSGIGSRRARNATRQRSFSDLPRPVGMSTGRSNAADIDIGRRSSTGKRLSDGLKRRFSSLRRKKAMTTEEVR